MRSSRHNERAAPAGTGSGSQGKESGWATTERNSNHSRGTMQLASLDKGRGARLLVSLSIWKDLRRVEIREATELLTGSGAFFPAGAGVKVPLDLIDDMIEALTAAKAKAIALGLLPSIAAEMPAKRSAAGKAPRKPRG
jgi:hypothetical protein